MAFPIRLNAFAAGNPLQMGNYQDVVAHIENSNAVIVEKAKAFFSCLSQSHHLDGPFKGECISYFETRIYIYFNGHPQEVMDAAHGQRFSHDKSLEKVIQKINYMAKNRFISNYENYYIRGTKFSHHLNRISKSLSGSSTSVGVGLIMVGTLSFINTGIARLLPGSETNTSTASKGVAISIIATGSLLAISPIVEAFEKAKTNEPD